jgi:sodium transport system permease protein
VIADPTRREATIPVQRIRGLLRAYGRQIGTLRLQLRGVAPSVATALAVKDVDLSTPQGRAALALVFLPYFLMITAFTGGMHLAIDSTAGEKERKSLEPLLINPVPRWQIMSGKMLATTVFALASLLLTMVSFRLAVPYMPSGALGFELDLSPGTVGMILLVIVPVAILAAALLTVLATLAKGFREAQSYMGLVVFIPMIPSLLYMSNPVKPESWMMLILPEPADRRHPARRDRPAPVALPVQRQHADDRSAAGRGRRDPVQPAEDRLFRVLRAGAGLRGPLPARPAQCGRSPRWSARPRAVRGRRRPRRP